jgi:hypothetical protein
VVRNGDDVREVAAVALVDLCDPDEIDDDEDDVAGVSAAVRRAAKSAAQDCLIFLRTMRDREAYLSARYDARAAAENWSGVLRPLVGLDGLPIIEALRACPLALAIGSSVASVEIAASPRAPTLQRIYFPIPSSCRAHDAISADMKAHVMDTVDYSGDAARVNSFLALSSTLIFGIEARAAAKKKRVFRFLEEADEWLRNLALLFALVLNCIMLARVDARYLDSVYGHMSLTDPAFAALIVCAAATCALHAATIAHLVGGSPWVIEREACWRKRQERHEAAAAKASRERMGVESADEIMSAQIRAKAERFKYTTLRRRAIEKLNALRADLRAGKRIAPEFLAAAQARVDALISASKAASKRRRAIDAVFGEGFWATSRREMTPFGVRARELWFLVSWPTLWLRVVLLIITLLGIFNGPWWFGCLPVEIIFRFPLLFNVLVAVSRNWKSLVSTGLLTIFLEYFFMAIGYYQFSDMSPNVDDVGIQGACTSMFRCFTTYLLYGLRAGSSIGDFSPAPMLGGGHSDEERHRYAVYAFYLANFIIVHVIVVNLVFGVILDTFSELRDEQSALLESQKTRCFVCGLGREELDRAADGGFDHHIFKEHNAWHYVYFFFHVAKVKSAIDYTGVESFVARALTLSDASGDSNDGDDGDDAPAPADAQAAPPLDAATFFMPLGRALCVSAAAEALDPATDVGLQALGVDASTAASVGAGAAASSTANTDGAAATSASTAPATRSSGVPSGANPDALRGPRKSVFFQRRRSVVLTEREVIGQMAVQMAPFRIQAVHMELEDADDKPAGGPIGPAGDAPVPVPVVDPRETAAAFAATGAGVIAFTPHVYADAAAALRLAVAMDAVGGEEDESDPTGSSGGPGGAGESSAGASAGGSGDAAAAAKATGTEAAAEATADRPVVPMSRTGALEALQRLQNELRHIELQLALAEEV